MNPNSAVDPVAPDVTPSFAVLIQYLLPKRALTAFAGFMASQRGRALSSGLIRWFVGKYRVDMSEAAEPDLARYASFNDFFTRALKPGARPLASSEWVSPVDGAISQFGRIEQDQIFQAKGHRYSTTALVGGDASLAANFANGHFATLYLSPRDYHRVHMPCDGRLRRMIHVPGDLFSVNPTTARGVPGLFARNERVVCVFDTARGPMVLALVGATVVGSIATVWHGIVTPPRGAAMREWRYGAAENLTEKVALKAGETAAEKSGDGEREGEGGEGGGIALTKGAEMGRFLLGSTVVLLFPAGPLRFDAGWSPGRSVQLGEAMATG